MFVSTVEGIQTFVHQTLQYQASEIHGEIGLGKQAIS
jgi:hypothetical protein